ncbi:MAG: hypothetical protein R2865_17870 [Deinococcales bacterium]
MPNTSFPFMCALAEALQERYPQASFVSPISHLLKPSTIAEGISGKHKVIGVSSRQEGNKIITPKGTVIKLIPESERYAHMRAADLAITIPGTNTLEIGIAQLPAVVMLPLNKPEAIPLEGIGHFVGLIPLIGPYLKGFLVKLIAPHLPVSLPNLFSGENLMLDIKRKVSLEEVLEATSNLLDDEARRHHIKERLAATMPKPGAAYKILESIITDLMQL